MSEVNPLEMKVLHEMFACLLKQADVHKAFPTYTKEGFDVRIPVVGNMTENPVILVVSFAYSSKVDRWRMEVRWGMPTIESYPVWYLIVAGQFADKIRSIAMDAWMIANRTRSIIRFQNNETGEVEWHSKFTTMSKFIDDNALNIADWLSNFRMLDGQESPFGTQYTIKYYAHRG